MPERPPPSSDPVRLASSRVAVAARHHDARALADARAALAAVRVEREVRRAMSSPNPPPADELRRLSQVLASAAEVL